MRFAHLTVLWIGIVAIVTLAIFLGWSWRHRQLLLTRFVDNRLLQKMLHGVDPVWQKWRLVLVVVISAFLWVTLAQPQWGENWEEATQRGRDILVAIDTSRSMLANDVVPNRLTRAKLAALDLMRLARQDRLGLIAFAGTAFLQCPLTLDEEAFRQSVNILDTGIIPQGGTALTGAIDAALGTFKNDSGDNHKVLIILTDGEDHEEGIKEAAAKAAKAGLKIFTVGVGTPSGELLRIKDEQGRESFVKDDQGNVVKSALNESLLRDLASGTQGFYLSLRENKAMEVLYEQGLRPLPTSEISTKKVKKMHDRFRWPLILGMLAMILEIFWVESGFRKKRLLSNLTAALLFLLLTSQSALASANKAQRDFEKGEFDKAREEYDRLLTSRPEDPRLQYNSGSSAYAGKDYAKAAQRFEAALSATDKVLQQHAYYNLGNTEYRLGENESDPKQKQEQWEQSLQHFEKALNLEPNDQDAKHNLELVRQQLEELKKQQKESSKDKKPQDKKDQDDKNSKDKSEDQKQDDKKQDPSESKDDKQSQEKKDDNKGKDSSSPKDSQDPQEPEKQDQSQPSKDQKPGEQKPSEDPAQQKAQEEAEQAADAKSAQIGQMTPKQARQMLEAQKGEEKAMIFLPPKDNKKPARNRIFKDW